MNCKGLKFAVVISNILVCFTPGCFATDQQTVLVVAHDGSILFYHQNGEPIDSEDVPKGTELTIESTSGERCFVTYKGKPAYIRRQFLIAREEFKRAYEAEQTAKGLVQYQGEWITPQERDQRLKQKFEAEQKAKGLVQYEGQWMLTNEVAQTVQRRAKEEEQARQEQVKQQEQARQEQVRQDEQRREEAAKLEQWMQDNARKVYEEMRSNTMTLTKQADAKYPDPEDNQKWGNYLEALFKQSDAELRKKYGVTQNVLNAVLDKGNQEHWMGD